MRDLEKNEDSWYGYSYSELLDSFELESVMTECCGSFQGDYVCLFRRGGDPTGSLEYGFLVFGYGSCSGCDALEAIGDDYQEVVALRDRLYESIRWGTPEETVAYLEEEEKRDWWMYDDEVKEAVAKVAKYIRENSRAPTK
jgi:hypothetical protein